MIKFNHNNQADSPNLKNYNSPLIHPINLQKTSQKKAKYRNFIIIFIFLVILSSFFIMLIGIYYKNWENSYVINLSKKIPLPAMLIGKNFILLENYYNDLQALKIFYNNQHPDAPIPVADLKKQVFYKLINQTLIEKAAKSFSINVTAEEINKEVDTIKNLNPSQNIDDLTQESFGWTFSEFIDRVIKFELTANKLNQYFLNSTDYQKDNKQKIEENFIYLQNGGDFDKIGETIGWLTSEQMGSQIFSQIENFSVGEYSNVIETNNGYYLIKLTNKLEITDKTTTYELSQIYVKKFDLNDFLSEQLKQTKIYRFINI